MAHGFTVHGPPSRLYGGPSLIARLLRSVERWTLDALLASAFIRAAALIAALGVNAVLARLLGPASFGMFAYAMSAVTLAGVVGEVGMRVLALREAARHRVHARGAALHGIVRFGLTATLIASLAICAAGIALLALLAEPVQAETWRLYILSALAVPLVALVNTTSGALRGLGAVAAGLSCEILLRRVFLLGLVGLLAALGLGAPTAGGAMGLHLMAAILAFAMAAILLWRRLGRWSAGQGVAYEPRAWLLAAGPLWLTAALTTLQGQIDLLMLGALRPADEVGVYRVAVQLAVLAAVAQQIANNVFGERFATASARKDHTQLGRYARQAAWIGTLGASVIFLVYLVAGGQVTGLVFGAPYRSAGLPLILLSGSALVAASTGSSGYLLNTSGHERVVAAWLLAAVGINALANYTLVPLYGPVGAAAATLGATCVWKAGLTVAVYRRLGLNPTAFGRLNVASASASAGRDEF